MSKARRGMLWALLSMVLLGACALVVLHLHANHNRVPIVLAQAQAALRAGQTMPVPKLTGAVDVNKADFDQLCELPGIGAKTARSIIFEREQNGNFSYPADLLNVKGIGEKTLQKLLPEICLD
ncbi:MAG: helix-hairpin-helix domain-containing protein [Clostridia bacterium]